MRIAWFVIGGMLLALGGCITDATFELTKAPFDATTALADGTTQATGELLQPLREFTSSTTPGTSFTGDHAARAKEKTDFFAAYAYDNLQSDIAKGGGEYLVSLATLAGVPDGRYDDFRVQMRRQYASFFDDRTLTPAASSARLANAAWAFGRGR